MGFGPNLTQGANQLLHNLIEVVDFSFSPRLILKPNLLKIPKHVICNLFGGQRLFFLM
jgi:hypothetical protein